MDHLREHAEHDTADLLYREMQPGEERSASDVIVRGFQEFISPRYPRAGVRDFLACVSPLALRERVAGTHTILVALAGSQVVGVADIDNFRHIDLLFVDKAYHGRGIAHELVSRAVERAREVQPQLTEITADTSEYGLSTYESMGFRPAGPELIECGRHFRRVRLRLKKTSRR